MTFDEIKQQTTYVKCQLGVCNIEPSAPSEFGMCQPIVAMDSDGNTTCINYFFDSVQMEINLEQEIPEWFKVKWMPKEGGDGYFKCYPCDVPANATRFAVKNGQSIMDKRTLGKCRHGILCAFIKAGKIDIIEIIAGNVEMQNKLSFINSWAKFSITGEIE